MISTRRHRLHPRGARSAAPAGIFDAAVPAALWHPATSSVARSRVLDHPREPLARVHRDTAHHLTLLRPERTPDPRG